MGVNFNGRVRRYLCATVENLFSRTRNHADAFTYNRSSPANHRKLEMLDSQVNHVQKSEISFAHVVCNSCSTSNMCFGFTWRLHWCPQVDMRVNLSHLHSTRVALSGAVNLCVRFAARILSRNTLSGNYAWSTHLEKGFGSIL